MKTLRKFLVATALLLSSQLVLAANPLIPAAPQIAGKGFLLIDAHSGEVLVSQNADETLPPASLTKMMTSYIATHELDKGNISKDDKVRVSIKAWKTPGSRMFIKEGTSVVVEDLLRGIIIQSGNDASVAMAEFIAGSEDAFADLMNQHASLLGMKGTHFMNATGLPSQHHYTTATDLATLARAIIVEHPQHYGMYSEQAFTYNGIRQPNRNKLLWRDKSVDGLKTGHTEEAGYCLVASAERNGMRLIAVMLGTKSEEARATETQKLLTYGFRYYETRKLYNAGEVLKEAKVWGGAEDKVNLGVAEDVYITVPRGQYSSLQPSMEVDEHIVAGVKIGAEYGKVQIKLQDRVELEQSLVALDTVEPGGFFKRLWDQLVLFFVKLIS
ncbi:MAG: D-alanyl-D-alanine carboxypeptidase family protein [Pseudomonadales bacterium]